MVEKIESSYEKHSFSRSKAKGGTRRSKIGYKLAKIIIIILNEVNEKTDKIDQLNIETVYSQEWTSSYYFSIKL